MCKKNWRLGKSLQFMNAIFIVFHNLKKKFCFLGGFKPMTSAILTISAIKMPLNWELVRLVQKKNCVPLFHIINFYWLSLSSQDGWILQPYVRLEVLEFFSREGEKQRNRVCLLLLVGDRKGVVRESTFLSFPVTLSIENGSLYKETNWPESSSHSTHLHVAKVVSR